MDPAAGGAAVAPEAVSTAEVAGGAVMNLIDGTILAAAIGTLAGLMAALAIERLRKGGRQ